jgi:hypothetical protein
MLAGDLLLPTSQTGGLFYFQPPSQPQEMGRKCLTAQFNERNAMRFSHSPGMQWVALLAIAAGLSGCASTGSSNESQAGRIKITSEPTGATAYSDGTEIGTTPLEIVPGDHFRSGFAGFSYRYIGKLSLKKAGCETWSTEVNDDILSKDINTKLKCDPNFQPTPPATTPTAGSTPVSPTKDQSIERLERIESLHKKGLISDEEFKQLRTRILEQL